MNIKEVKELIQDILQSDISEFELEHTGTKVKLRRGSPLNDAGASQATHAAARFQAITHEPHLHITQSSVPPVAPRVEPAVEEGLHLITSPIVGTFYRAPSPGADAYVSPGTKIEVGTILCIVEAMKLMNEIPSDVSGEVAEIYVENGVPVEYGQKLFGIRPRKQA